jgi:hypothetical protein
MREKPDRILKCRFRRVIPVRFALCTHTDCTIPDNVQKAFNPGARLPVVNHRYTLRTLDNGYIFATWSTQLTEDKIAIYRVRNGRLSAVGNTYADVLGCTDDAIIVPGKVKQFYMLFIRIPESEEEFPTDRDKHVWKEMRKNLAADPFGQMQLVTLGKAVNPGLRQYSYEASSTCFHADDLPLHVEECAKNPGGLLRLRQENLGVKLFERPQPEDDKEWSPRDLCDRLSARQRWDASATPFYQKSLATSSDDADQPTTHHDTHVACLVDPVGMIYDMVTAYSAGLEDLSLYARWHEPMIVSGELTRLYEESEGRKDSSSLAPYNAFKEKHTKALNALEDRLKLITDTWQALMQDTRPIYSFQFQLGNFFLSDDQRQPSPVDPTTAFDSDEIPADPLTVARLAILAGAFYNIASRPQSFATLDKLLTEGSPLSELFQKTVGEGAVPGNEYGLLLTNLTNYLAERGKKKETIQGVLPLISAFNKRLGLSAAEPTNTLGRGLFLAETWMNKSEYAPVPGLEEIKEDSEVERALGILGTGVEALLLPMEAFLKEDLKKLDAVKAEFDEAQQDQRDAQRRLAQSQEQLDASAQKVKKAQALLDTAVEERRNTNQANKQALMNAKDAVDKALQNLDDTIITKHQTYKLHLEVQKNPLGTGKSMRMIFFNYETARDQLDEARTSFHRKYQLNIGSVSLTLTKTELRVADARKVEELQMRQAELNQVHVQGKAADEAAEMLEKTRKAQVEAAKLSWDQDFAQRGAADVEFGEARFKKFNAETALHHTETRHHFTTSLGRAVNALDGTLSAVNLCMTAHRLSKAVREKRIKLMPFMRDILSVAADGQELMAMTLAVWVARTGDPLAKILLGRITLGAVRFNVAMDIVEIYILATKRDYDAAVATTLSFGCMLAPSLGLVAVATPVGILLLLAGVGFALLAAHLTDGALKTAATNNYWNTGACKELDAYPIHDLKSPFAVKQWHSYFQIMKEAMTELFSPQLSVEVVDGKRLRVTTRCFRPVMLGPASAGVGVRVPRLFGHGPISSLDGGQLAQAPIEQEKDGMLESVLEFDVSKILLQAKDILGTPVVNPYDHGKLHYSIEPSAAVFHMCSADMDLFTKSKGFPMTVTLQRDLNEPDFSDKDIVAIAL